MENENWGWLYEDAEDMEKDKWFSFNEELITKITNYPKKIDILSHPKGFTNEIRKREKEFAAMLKALNRNKYAGNNMEMIPEVKKVLAKIRSQATKESAEYFNGMYTDHNNPRVYNRVELYEDFGKIFLKHFDGFVATPKNQAEFLNKVEKFYTEEAETREKIVDGILEAMFETRDEENEVQDFFYDINVLVKAISVGPRLNSKEKLKSSVIQDVFHKTILPEVYMGIAKRIELAPGNLADDSNFMSLLFTLGTQKPFSRDLLGHKHVEALFVDIALYLSEFAGIARVQELREVIDQSALKNIDIETLQAASEMFVGYAQPQRELEEVEGRLPSGEQGVGLNDNQYKVLMDKPLFGHDRFLASGLIVDKTERREYRKQIKYDFGVESQQYREIEKSMVINDNGFGVIGRMPWGVNYVLFHDGHLGMNEINSRPMEKILSSKEYELIRLYVLGNYYQAVHADYKAAEVVDIINVIKRETAERQEKDEDTFTLSQATTRELLVQEDYTKNYLDDYLQSEGIVTGTKRAHTRILRVGQSPSRKKFDQFKADASQLNLYAFVVQKGTSLSPEERRRQTKVIKKVEFQQLDTFEAFEDFRDEFLKTYEKPGFEVRFQTYVKRKPKDVVMDTVQSVQEASALPEDEIVKETGKKVTHLVKPIDGKELLD